MPRFVALLRGINVGGHRVKMERLRELFREMGYSDVDTFIASGNVIFTSSSDDVKAHGRTISSRLQGTLGYEVATFIRTPREVEAAASFESEVGASPPGSIYVIFSEAPLGDDVRSALSALESETDRFVFRGRETYWVMSGKLSESPLFGGEVTRALKGVPHTTRNITSLRKLAAKHGPRDA